jgi:signal transduction histidine kinase
VEKGLQRRPADSDGGRPAVLRGRLRDLSADGLRWVMGLFCSFIGAFLLIAPHHFQAAPYQALLPFALAWGAFALASGVGLLAVTVLHPSPWTARLAHLLVGLTLLALALSFAVVGAVSGTVVYTVLGLGVVLAGLLPQRRQAGAGGDLFGLLMGLVATLSGLMAAVRPQIFRSAFYGPYRDQLILLGWVMLATGPFLVYAQLRPGLRRTWAWAFHLAAGFTFLTFGALFSLPARSWTGVALYWGGGAALAVLPWLRPRLDALDTAMLQARVSLVLVIATSLALILATAVVTAQEEKLTEEEAQAAQAVEAKSIAQNVSDFIEMNGARAATLAAFAGRSAMTVEDQGELLREARTEYPDLVALRTVTGGRVVAAAGGEPLPLPEVLGLAADVGHAPRRMQITPIQLGERALLLVGAPIHGDDRLDGTLVAAFAAGGLEGRISREGSRVTVADGRGRTIARVNGLVSEPPLPALPVGWDRPDHRRGPGRVPEVAGFARIPQLGWAVAVERPRADALAGVRRGRDLAFGLLLVVIPLTVVAGLYASRRIARPLGDLAVAVGEMTAGNLAAPLGAASSITEVAHLSAAFEEMRDRLAARTRESERLAAELRARAEALAETDRRKDEFLAMLAHELRNPLGAIANASYLLEQMGTGDRDERMAKPVAIIRRQIQHLVRMVDDLLDVSRITRGKVELRREPLDLGEVLQHAVEAARPLAATKSQSLRMDLAGSPLPVEGDATRLEQVFSNLLRNALKFTEAGGGVEVSAHRDGHGGDAEAVVRVRDDGIGISAELLPRIFDLFAQGEQGLDRAGAGLGIGLTLVRSLVEMHGGRVEARSEGRGRGSEIEVRLPLVDR